MPNELLVERVPSPFGSSVKPPTTVYLSDKVLGICLTRLFMPHIERVSVVIVVIVQELIQYILEYYEVVIIHQW